MLATLVSVIACMVLMAAFQGKSRLEELIIEKRHTVEDSLAGMYSAADSVSRT